jgi:rRNA-processing protein FCF1
MQCNGLDYVRWGVTAGLGAGFALDYFANIDIAEVLQTYLGNSARNYVVLDTNAVIAAVEGGGGAAVLAGSSPLVPITVVQEFLAGGGSIQALRSFLAANGGGIALAGEEAVAATLRAQATALGRVLGVADSRVVASALKNAVMIVTNDLRLANFLRAVGIPVRGF